MHGSCLITYTIPFCCALPSTFITRFIGTMAQSDFPQSHGPYLRSRLASFFFSGDFQGSPKFRTPLCKLAVVYDPGIWQSIGFVRMTSAMPFACCVMYRVGSPYKQSFGAEYVHPFGLRLECFAVYASPPSLPQATQDSLHDGSDSSFPGGTYTRKRRPASLGAHIIPVMGLASRVKPEPKSF